MAAPSYGPYPTNLNLSYTLIPEDQTSAPAERDCTDLFGKVVIPIESAKTSLPSTAADWTKTCDHKLLEATREILLKLSEAPPEVQLAAKRLFATGIYPQYSKYLTPSKDPVKPIIHENNFQHLVEATRVLNENLKTLHKTTDVRVNRISGATATLKQGKSDPQFETKKEVALPLLNHYEKLYNAAVDSLKDMKTIAESNEKLQKSVMLTIDEFIKLNDQWINYLNVLFSQIAAEKDYVEQRVTSGAESRQTQILSRIWGSSAVLPATKSLANSETSQEESCDEFSSLFAALNHNYHELKLFTQIDVQLLSNGISGTRKGWTEANPHFESFKTAAADFPKAYDPELEKSQQFHTSLASYNIRLNALRKGLNDKLAANLVELAKSKELLISVFKNYRMESQNLDRAINLGTLSATTSLKELKADSAEKYPVKAS